MELGHRIEHLQILIDSTKDKVKKSDENQKIFRTFESDRIEKYLLMEENINKAEKNYGKFSQNLCKNR
jgi:pantothenate kinase